jgi:hypothetical protein
VRDRTCAVPGCGKRLGLERDHRGVDFSDDGPTELDNLVRGEGDAVVHADQEGDGQVVGEGTRGSSTAWLPTIAL